jgi:exosortase
MSQAMENLAVQVERASVSVLSRQGSQLLILMCLVLLLYSGILAQLASNWWSDPNYSHGFLVPAFSAFVLWRNRRNLADLPRKPSWFGFVVIAGALLVLIAGVLGAELFLSRSSLLFLSAGLVIYFLGWNHFRAVLFPWGILFLMIPLPVIVFNLIVLPLQFLASQLATWLLANVGVPVLRAGNIIQLPSITLEVAEACSGIRSLMSLVALATFYGYLFESRVLRRIVLIIAAVPIAVAANALRIAGTGLLAEYWSPEKAEGFLHLLSGWVMFLLALILLHLFRVAYSRLSPRGEGNHL